jgi:hypothetical protein
MNAPRIPTEDGRVDRGDLVGVARLADDGTIHAALARLAGRPVEGVALEDLVAEAQRPLVRSLLSSAAEQWTQVYLGFVRNDVEVPVDQVAHIGRLGGETVVVVERATVAALSVEAGLLTLVDDLVDVQRRLAQRSRELEAALEEVRSARLMLRKLEGIVPVCVECGRVRSDDDRAWVEPGTYLEQSGVIAISHSYCPECERRAMDGAGPPR